MRGKESTGICPCCNTSFYLKPSRRKNTKGAIFCSMECKKKMIKIDKKYHNGTRYYTELDKFLGAKLTRIKMSARKRGYTFDLDREYFFNCYREQEGLCYYTKVPLSINKEDIFNLMSIDRKDNSKGYIKGNIVFCCMGINSMKFNYTSEQVFDFIKLIKQNGI